MNLYMHTCVSRIHMLMIGRGACTLTVLWLRECGKADCVTYDNCYSYNAGAWHRR